MDAARFGCGANPAYTFSAEDTNKIENESSIITKQRDQLRQLSFALLLITRGKECPAEEIDEWLSRATLEEIEKECQLLFGAFHELNEGMRSAVAKRQEMLDSQNQFQQNIEKLRRKYFEDSSDSRLYRW